jgi:hypothetical protein
MEVSFMQVLMMAAMAAASLGVTTTSELEWSDHYANAKVQAAAEHRPLLVVLEDSANPQGRFDQQGLASQDSQVELLNHFRLCRMDVKTEYGKRVAEAFGAKQFPFTAITDKSAQYITFQAGGTMSADQWQQTLATRKDGELVSPSVQRVEASKIITGWPADGSSGSYCPNCVRRYR